jgi:hypothetical protein
MGFKALPVMDNSAGVAILPPVMLRQLLTALAILTGLAAAGAPAQAAPLNQVASVRVVAAAEFVSKCTMPSSGPALTQAPVQKDDKPTCTKPRPPVILPPVMLGVDRALE